MASNLLPLASSFVRLNAGFAAAKGSVDARPLARVDRAALKKCDGTPLNEQHYDQLIVDALESIASALVGAGMLHPDATLEVLRKQFPVSKSCKIDVLCAEMVDSEFQRFVIFEDKLIANAEARREVVAQVLEYAAALQDANYERVKSLCNEGLNSDKSDVWSEDNIVGVNRCLDAGDFLVVICGDEIDPRVERISRQFASGTLLRSRARMALLALPIYSDRERYYLMPCVVGATQYAKREMTIQVTVNDPARGGQTSIQEAMSTNPEKAVSKSVAFEDTWLPAENESLALVLDNLMKGIDGLTIEYTNSGAPLVRMKLGNGAIVTPLRAQLNTGKLADSLQELERKLGTPSSDVSKAVLDAIGNAIRVFRAALTNMGGGSKPNGRVHILVATVEDRHGDVVAALLALRAALSASPEILAACR